MGSIIHQRSFEAPRRKSERRAEYSVDREPWRAFRSSLAVEFTSARRGGWAPDQLSDATKAEIIAGLEARSAIISRYSRIQSLMRDLVAKAGFSALGGQGAAYSAGREKVLSYAKKLTTRDGLLSVCPQMLSSLFDRIEETAAVAEFVTGGFVEVREEKNGAIRFRLQQQGKRQSFTSKDLRAQATSLEHLAGEVECQLAAALVIV